MPVNTAKWKEIITGLGEKAALVAVSKTKPLEDLQEMYALGQRDFGENYVQELIEKKDRLPQDIRWHFIGHLQTNKVKEIVPFVHLIQGVDSAKLLKEIQKQAAKRNRTLEVLLQVHIAQEETKFGLDEPELAGIVAASSEYSAVAIRGLMGMASNTDDPETIRREFRHLHTLFEKYRTQQASNPSFSVLSMGMSGDYQLALSEGSNMVRIGSLLFGAR